MKVIFLELYLHHFAEDMKIVKVACAIIYFEQKILVVQRSELMKLPLKWEFPGGKIERGESEISCVIREIKEELDINIQVNKRLNPNIYHYENISIELIPYSAKYVSGNINLKEHNQYLFINPEDMSGMDWAEADIPIVDQIIENAL
jgi:8-oxo-dGTP diphosphatase